MFTFKRVCFQRTALGRVLAQCRFVHMSFFFSNDRNKRKNVLSPTRNWCVDEA